MNDNRLCMRVADGQDVTGRFNYRGSFCIDQDGQDIRDFTKLGVKNPALGGYTNVVPVGYYDDGSDDVIARINLRTQYSEDLYRFNTRTGKARLLTFDSPGWVQKWILDRRAHV